MIWLIIFGVIQMVTSLLFVDIFNQVAMKQVTRIRIRFFQSIICQEMCWYDKSAEFNFASRLTE